METEDLKSYVVPALVGVGVLGALYYFTRGEGEVASLPILGGVGKSKAIQLTDEKVVQIVKDDLLTSLKETGLPTPEWERPVQNVRDVEVKVTDSFEIGVPSAGEYYLFNVRPLSNGKQNPNGATSEDEIQRLISEVEQKASVVKLSPSSKVVNVEYTITSVAPAANGQPEQESRYRGNYSVVLTEDGKIIATRSIFGPIVKSVDIEIPPVPDSMKEIAQDPVKGPIYAGYRNASYEFAKARLAFDRPVGINDISKLVSNFVEANAKQSAAYEAYKPILMDIQRAQQQAVQSSRSTERQGRRKKAAEAAANPSMSTAHTLLAIGLVFGGFYLLDTRSR